MTGTGEIDHIEIVALDDAVEVRIDKILPRTGSPMAHDGLLQVAFAKRALQQRIIEKIQLAGCQIVCGAPIGVDLLEFLR